jgi:nucleoside-diphosphate-sugar epimerase
VAELRARGVATVAHIRPDSRRLDAFREQFGALGARVDTTPWEQAAMTATLAELRPTHLFALLGTTAANAREERKRTGRNVDYDSVDYGLTNMLLLAASRSSLRPRFVYLSSIGVRETAPGAYMQARWKAEQAIIHSNLPYTIVRPSFISGEDRDETRPMERIAASMSAVMLGGMAKLGARSLHDRWAPMTGEQLARAIVSLALESNAQNRVYEGEEIPRA